MAMGKRRRRPKQTSMWVATPDLPRTAAHPFYTRLNQILDKADFDGYVESLCQRFYADNETAELSGSLGRSAPAPCSRTLRAAVRWGKRTEGEAA
jgi:hypothetical protein